MKKALFKHIIPNTALGTLIMFIFTAVFNMMYGVNVAYYVKWMVLIVGYAGIYTIYYYVLEKVEIKNTILAYIIEYLYWYFCLAGISLLTGWIGFSVANLILYAVCTLIAYVAFCLYYKVRIRMQAEEINELIARKKNIDTVAGNA